MSFVIDHFEDTSKWTEVVVGMGTVTDRTVNSFKANCVSANDVAGLVTVNPHDLTEVDIRVMADRRAARTILLIREQQELTDPLTPAPGKYLYAFIRDQFYGVQIYNGYGYPHAEPDPVHPTLPAEMRIVISGGTVYFYYNGMLIYSEQPPTWAGFDFSHLYVYCLSLATSYGTTTPGQTTFSVVKAVITGVVTDATTGKGIEGATITINGYTTATDASGFYTIAVTPKVYTVSASKAGYEPQSKSVDASAGGTFTVNFSLTPLIFLIRDDFNDNILDTTIWRIFRPAGKVYERNMRIEVEPVEEASGIRLRNRVDFRDFEVRVDRDPRKCDWVQLTIGYHPDCEGDWGTLSWLNNHYSFWFRSPWKLLSIHRNPASATPEGYPAGDVEVWSGTWSQPCARVKIRIERHPDYPTEERYIIRFFEGENEVYSEECTWLIQAINGMGLVELFSRKGLTGWDNFEIKRASSPEPTTYTVTVQEVSNSNGFICPGAGIYRYPEGSKISFAAIPNVGYLFNGWIINGETRADAQIILTIDRDFTVQSNGFSRDPNYRLLRIINNFGGKTDLPSGVHAFPVGQKVTVKATPETVDPPGITPSFKQWLLDGQPAGASPSITVDMSDDHTLETTWTHPVPYDTWFLRVADILPDTPPAPPLDGPNFDKILDDIVKHNTEKKEINFAETRCYWWWDEVNDPTGNNPVIKENPPWQPTLDQIRAAIRKIKAHGLKAAIWLCPTWGAKVPYRERPSGFDPELFIENYFKNCAIPVARICQEEGADMLVLGGEMENPQAGVTDENERLWAVGHNEKRAWGIREVKKVFKGIVSYNIQAWYQKAGFEIAKQMLFLKEADVIMLSAWYQMNHIPVDPRDVAWGIWYDWLGMGPGSIYYVNLMAWFNEFSTIMGRKVYLNSGYQNWTGSILAPWMPPENVFAEMDPQEQQFAWRGALQAMRWQPWCAGYDMERYNENMESHPPPYRTTSWRYHPENQEAIFKELNTTLTEQLPAPTPPAPTPPKPVGILALWTFPICSRIPNIPPCPLILEWAKRMELIKK
jgi:hypothetical protein